MTKDKIKEVMAVSYTHLADASWKRAFISSISFNGRVQYSSSLPLVVNKIWQRYFNTTDRKLSCVAVTLKLSMINRVSDFRERRKRLCLWKRSCSVLSGRFCKISSDQNNNGRSLCNRILNLSGVLIFWYE